MYLTVKQAAESLLTAIDRKKTELDSSRALTEGELDEMGVYDCALDNDSRFFVH